MTLRDPAAKLFSFASGDVTQYNIGSSRPDETMSDIPEFSDHPGAWERQLKLRAGNVLFGEQAAVNEAELQRARQRDEQERQAFARDFGVLLRDAASLSPQVETEKVLELKQQIDRLMVQCASLGGGYAREKDGLTKLNEVIVDTLRRASGDDKLAQQELNAEQAAWREHLRLLEYSLVADLLRVDSPVTPDMLIPTLLSQDENTLAVVLNLFDGEQLTALSQAARDHLRNLSYHEVDTSQWSGRMDLLTRTALERDTGSPQ